MESRYFCLFVCLGFIVPLENFSPIWRRHHYRWRAANFDLCSALMAIEQWGFISVPHLLLHGAYVYNGHLRRPVTLTPFAERFAVELPLPVLTTSVGTFACGANALTHCATAAVRGISVFLGSHLSYSGDHGLRLRPPSCDIFSKYNYYI